MESGKPQEGSNVLSNLVNSQESNKIEVTNEKLMQALDLLKLPSGTTVTITIQASSSIVR